jgi:hypothetical protein
MKRSHKAAAGVAAALSLGVAAAVFAHPGQMGGGMGPAMKSGMGHGPMASGPSGFAAGQQLMTPEERAALQEKMRNAKTPEERQKLTEANRAEMQKRAKEKGITLPDARGPGAGFGPRFAPPAAQAHRGGMGPGIMRGMGPGMMRGMGPGAAPGSHGPMGGPMAGGVQHDDAFADDMQLVRGMLFSHDRIKRTVTNLPDGIRTVTESDDPQVAQVIQTHVASMVQRLGDGKEFNLFSKTIPVLFENRDKIKTTVETTAKGSVVTQTSSDAKVVTALQEHAAEVDELVRDGMAAMMRGMMAARAGGARAQR